MSRPLIIILGVPGCGKGTQGRMLSSRFGMAYLATGDLVRAVRKQAGSGDAFATQVKERYDRGRPQPDAVIVKILRDTLSALDLEKGIILDSYPLSLGQTQQLLHIIEDFELDTPIIFFLTIDEWESIRRISNRKFCPACSVAFNPDSDPYRKGECPTDGTKLITRTDDSFRVVRSRMREYVDRMEHIHKYLKGKGHVIDINGQQTMDEVHQEIARRLKERGIG